MIADGCPRQQDLGVRFTYFDHFRSQRGSVIDLRDQIGKQSMLFQRFFCPLSDGGYFYPAKAAKIFAQFYNFIKEDVHTSGAGKSDPLVGFQTIHRLFDFFIVFYRAGFDGR